MVVGGGGDENHVAAGETGTARKTQEDSRRKRLKTSPLKLCLLVIVM